MEEAEPFDGTQGARPQHPNHETARPQAKLLTQRRADRAMGVLNVRAKRFATCDSDGKAPASVLNVRAKRAAICDSADKAPAGVLNVRAKRARTIARNGCAPPAMSPTSHVPPHVPPKSEKSVFPPILLLGGLGGWVGAVRCGKQIPRFART